MQKLTQRGKGDGFKEPGYLHRNLMAQLDAVERETGVASGYDTTPGRFAHLLEALHRETRERDIVQDECAACARTVGSATRAGGVPGSGEAPPPPLRAESIATNKAMAIQSAEK